MRLADLDPTRFVAWLRQAAPYIHGHRGRTFVVAVPGAQCQPPWIDGLVHDLALLTTLGVRVVLVPGARPQVEARLKARGIDSVYAGDTVDAADEAPGGLRVTDAEALECVKEAVGEVRMALEARLSTTVAVAPGAAALGAPASGVHVRVTSGNLVTARPVGVRNGVDHLYTGEVRRVDQDAVRQRLDDGDLVLISPLGYSPTGELFNLSAESVARATAEALRADKLIHLAPEAPLHDARGQLLTELTPSEARERIRAGGLSGGAVRLLQGAIHACGNGVERVHLLEHATEGALLLELFTRDGVGTLITPERFETVRPAQVEDIPGILALVRPMEEAGELVHRPRELLETEIHHFTVIERDGALIATAALLPVPGTGFAEVACLAVDPDYQGEGRAETLLETLERNARRSHHRTLFALTTAAEHFFRERGFVPSRPDELPEARRTAYDRGRSSKVLIKAVGEG